MANPVPGLNDTVEIGRVALVRFEEVRALLHDAASLCSAIVAQLSAKDEGRYCDAAVCLLARRLAEHYDAASVLASVGAGSAICAHYRIIVEAIFQIDFLLQDPTSAEDRAVCLFYWDRASQENLLSRQLSHLAMEGEDWNYLAKDQAADVLREIGASSGEKLVEISSRIEEIRTGLASAVFQQVRKQHLQRGRLPKNWFALCGGGSSLRDLAGVIGRTFDYDYFYRRWSETVHSTDLLDGIGADQRGKRVVKRLRHFEDIEMHAGWAVQCLHRTVKGVSESGRIRDESLEVGYRNCRLILSRWRLTSRKPLGIKYSSSAVR
jgi:hypothetical protein